MAAKKHIEIEVFGMRRAAGGHHTLAKRDEVQYWDLHVREVDDMDDPEWTGEVTILEEHEFLTDEQAAEIERQMQEKYPTASTDGWITD